MNIGLIPLDERPANTRYPAMIAAIAGAQVTLPPAALLSAQRRPADCAALAVWLQRSAPTFDALVVSCEMLGYGGLIASRISDEPASVVLARLDSLRAIKHAHPALPIYAFNVITRVSNANDAVEEPEAWAVYGERMYQLSQLLDRQEQGQPVAGELSALRAAVPEALLQSVLRRHLRNHTVNLAALALLAEGTLDLLVLSSDDTSSHGLPAREKRLLTSWAALLGFEQETRRQGDRETRRQGDAQNSKLQTPFISHPADAPQRLLMYPGADEVGCVLLARLLNQHAGVTPRFSVVYAPPEAAEQVAAYEDGPVRVTVERQIAAIGGVLVEEQADVQVAVNAPVARRSEWQPAFAAPERASRGAALHALAEGIAAWQARGQPVVVADVAYPNGADPALVELLQARAQLPALAAYGAWNTAGNTIGTALAQACAAQFISGDSQRAAQERFLLHRFVEDWGYQQIVRAEVRQWLRATHGAAEPTLETLPATLERIARQLDALIAALPGFAGRYRLAPSSVRLPWSRLFEVDFDLS